jgi:predicted flap endonuclease-1-like 5' DNA nuclease
VAWFLGQSLPIIFLAFVLGVLVGWLWWGRAWRRVRVAEPAVEAVTQPIAEQVTQPVEEPTTVLPVEEKTEALVAVGGGPVGRFLESPVEAGTHIDLSAEPKTIVVEAPEPAPAEEPAPEPEPQPEPDDLQRIEGIGPKMEGALRGAGIRTYRQLAETDVERLRAAIEAAGLRFAPSLTTWARQAKLLADGDEEGFADLIRRLVAGRDVGRE